jgi:uncharacterized membrane protein
MWVMEIRPATITALYSAVGLLFVGLGIPLALRRVPPNAWYGFRTAKTFSDPRIWYSANRVSGIDLMIAGVVLAIGVMVLFGLRASVIPSLRLATWCFGLFVSAMLAAVVHSFWYLNRL